VPLFRRAADQRHRSQGPGLGNYGMLFTRRLRCRRPLLNEPCASPASRRVVAPAAGLSSWPYAMRAGDHAARSASCCSACLLPFWISGAGADPSPWPDRCCAAKGRSTTCWWASGLNRRGRWPPGCANEEPAVLIGMIHVMLPYAILTLLRQTLRAHRLSAWSPRPPQGPGRPARLQAFSFGLPAADAGLA